MLLSHYRDGGLAVTVSLCSTGGLSESTPFPELQHGVIILTETEGAMKNPSEMRLQVRCVGLSVMLT